MRKNYLSFICAFRVAQMRWPLHVCRRRTLFFLDGKKWVLIEMCVALTADQEKIPFYANKMQFQRHLYGSRLRKQNNEIFSVFSHNNLSEFLFIEFKLLQSIFLLVLLFTFTVHGIHTMSTR